MPITFPVSAVAPSAERIAPVDPEPRLAKMLAGSVVEQWQISGALPIVACDKLHPLVAAAWFAFDQHYPLVLSPDAVWFTIAQGFSHHVRLHAEELRSRFVRHDGKHDLLVARDDFTLGRDNPWPEVFGEFSDQIAAHVGRLRELIRADFSTTGPLERAATDVLAMDTFQHYFTYTFSIGCGIPSITLTGTPDDWRSISRRAAMLSEFGLEWWTDELRPVLEQFVLAAEGRAETRFWKSLVRYESGSMGTELTGWIHTLLPYLFDRDHQFVRNEFLVQWHTRYEAALARANDERQPLPGPSLQQIPHGYASAPVTLQDVRTAASVPLRFVGGLLGVGQEPGNGTLHPLFGWVVTRTATVDAPDEPAGEPTESQRKEIANLEAGLVSAHSRGGCRASLMAMYVSGRTRDFDRLRQHARDALCDDNSYDLEGNKPFWALVAMDALFREEAVVTLKRRRDAAAKKARPGDTRYWREPWDRLVFRALVCGALPVNLETPVDRAWWRRHHAFPSDYVIPSEPDGARILEALAYAVPLIEALLDARESLYEWREEPFWEALARSVPTSVVDALFAKGLAVLETERQPELLRGLFLSQRTDEAWKWIEAEFSDPDPVSVPTFAQSPPSIGSALIGLEVALARGDAQGAVRCLERGRFDDVVPPGTWITALRRLGREGHADVVIAFCKQLLQTQGYVPPIAALVDELTAASV